ncbi:Hypothetical protein CINCED_3A014699 [Cinara cedri]|uniref:Uncharacterized protein n=1 Tax=Cinara cedri TaxID=506608 RepID=A0A5E4M0B5_9HEMI|nr:Hypothetical protein CINCED_3A014699 [Cinara cedri]
MNEPSTSSFDSNKLDENMMNKSEAVLMVASEVAIEDTPYHTYLKRNIRQHSQDHTPSEIAICQHLAYDRSTNKYYGQVDMENGIKDALFETMTREHVLKLKGLNLNKIYSRPLF